MFELTSEHGLSCFFSLQSTRVDVNKSASSISHERVIVIRGQPENCMQACREILNIMYTDAQTKNKTSDLVLKVLAHNNFIGRIIGKGGNIINTIKTDTETNITVSSINELNTANIERIISIKGELNQQVRALEMIYTKLCAAFEHDQARGWHYASSALPHYQQQHQHHHHHHHQQQQQQQQHAHLVQYFPQQSTIGANLMPTHYALSANNNSNAVLNKCVEPSVNTNGIHQPSYYVSSLHSLVVSRLPVFIGLAAGLSKSEFFLCTVSGIEWFHASFLCSIVVSQWTFRSSSTYSSVSTITKCCCCRRKCTFVCAQRDDRSDYR
jgi:predicted RNA-binding protein YlqC (UPF0109 family)